MSPISTAQLNHEGNSFCLPTTGSTVLIPVLLNNTNPTHLTYSITPLGRHTPNPRDIETVEIGSKELKAIEQARVETLKLARTAASSEEEDEYDEYDDESSSPSDHSHPNLQKTQSIVHIKLSKPAIVRLERVIDSSGVEARLVIPSEALVVPCPKAEFVQEKTQTADNIRCMGQDPDVQLMMDIRGIPPLSLRWSRAINGRKEVFLVEGIEGDGEKPVTSETEAVQVNIRARTTRSVAAPEELQVPLTVSLNTPGVHVYTLEEVMDAVGNVIFSPFDGRTDDKTVQSFRVLQRPSMSFKHCSPGNPTPLLIGSESRMVVTANEVDSLDAPWSVDLKYMPSSEGENEKYKKYKPWKKTLTTEEGKREIIIPINTPGEFTIAGVRGKVSTQSRSHLCH